jgi:hypothetical protein
VNGVARLVAIEPFRSYAQCKSIGRHRTQSDFIAMLSIGRWSAALTGSGEPPLA